MNRYGIREATLKALALAKGAAKVGIKIQFAKEPSYVDTWLSPLVKDPFNVPMEKKYELLNDCCERMKAAGVVLRRGGFVLTSIEKYFVSSQGSQIFTGRVYCGRGWLVA